MQENAVVPSMSATLEWLKYMGNLELPTQFYEAELDYFGKVWPCSFVCGSP